MDTPLVSAHSGLSGSKYDKKIPKPLSSSAILFAAATQSAMERRGVQPSSGRARAAPKSATETLEGIIRSRRAGPSPGGAGRHSTAPFALDEDHASVAKSVFTFLDGDGDGELTDEELRVAMTAMGIPPTWDFLKAVKDLAPKGHGVDCDLFLDCLEEKCEQDKVRTSDLDVLFKEFASGAGAGNVHGYKIRQLFAGVETAFGTQVTNEEVDELFSDLGVSDQAVVDFKEFVLALTSGFVQLDWSK